MDKGQKNRLTDQLLSLGMLVGGVIVVIVVWKFISSAYQESSQQVEKEASDPNAFKRKVTCSGCKHVFYKAKDVVTTNCPKCGARGVIYGGD